MEQSNAEVQTTEYSVTTDICGQLISPGGFLHHRRSFEYHVLIFVLEGTLYITANEVPYSVSAGQYILLRAGEEHYGHQESDGALKYLWVHFMTEMPQQRDGALLQEKTENAVFPEYGTVRYEDRISLYFRQLLNLSLEETPLTKQMQNHLVSLCLLELGREHLQTAGAEKLPTVVSSVAEWIKTHYYQEFTVAELAERFGYQADYLSSLFKKTMGVSIVKYTTEIRIKTAKTLLMNYGLSIKEAAYSCGFSDEKYFMKVFKQYEGMTPSQYRQSVT